MSERRHRCDLHGLYTGAACPVCVELRELRARLVSREILLDWAARSRLAWRAAAEQANGRLCDLQYGRPVATPHEDIPDELVTPEERHAAAIAKKTAELREAEQALQRSEGSREWASDVDMELGGFGGYTSWDWSARTARDERDAADGLARIDRLRAELEELRRAG